MAGGIGAAAPCSDLLALTHDTEMSIYVGRVLNFDPLAFGHDLTTPIAVIPSAQNASRYSAGATPRVGSSPAVSRFLQASDTDESYTRRPTTPN